MYYKIDLNNYKKKVVPFYDTFVNYKNLKWEQVEMLTEELENFQDSFGKPWDEWDLTDLQHRLKNDWSFYLITDNVGIKAWSFIDWNKKYPYLCNRYVVPKHRNKGLGNDLVWLRCNEIIKQGYNYASIKLEDWNKPALSVMKENIFTELTEI